jgi:hypothetical protein
VIYVVAPLFQLPIEQSTSANKEWFLWTISLLAILFIVWVPSSRLARLVRSSAGSQRCKPKIGLNFSVLAV